MDGIKETKEAMVGFLKLSVLLAANFKDGFQAADVSVIIAKITGDEVLKAALLDAYNGIDKIGPEMGHLTIAEGIELAMTAMPEIVNLIGALKK